MAIADVGLGAQLGLRDLLLQRVKAQQFADQMRQQQFENQTATRKLAQQDELTRLAISEKADAAAAGAQQKATTEANSLGEQLQPGTELMPQNPAVSMLQQGGRGALLQPRMTLPSRQMAGGATAPETEGGSFPSTQPAQGYLRTTTRTDAKPEVYIKTATQKQNDTNTDNARQADAIARQREADTERERHDKATEAALLNKPNTAADSRMDRSYQFHRSALDKIAKPLEDQQQRMGRLIESVNQGTPQADALVAPELLTVMAGGAGSGLRMNEAEISRVIGGRSKWQTLQATLNQWATDPSKANSITPEQRQDIRKLIAAVHDKSQQALAAVNDAGDRLVDAPDVLSHRKVLTDARKRLQQIYEPASGAESASGGGGLVAMVAPDGRALNVPADKVAELEAKGAKRR